MIQIDLSDTEITFENKVERDSLLNSEFSTFKLPLIHCPVENIEFQPEIKIYDKYLHSDTLDYRQISDTLYSYLQNRFEILSSMMCTDEYGHLFGFVVQGDSRFLYYFHLVDFEKKHILIETISTFGTKRNMDIDLKNMIKRIKSIKN